VIVLGAPCLGKAEIREVARVMKSGWIGTGPRTAAFEESFRRHSGARHAVAVSSGTAALHLSMLAAGVGPGDEVITTPMTFAATANAIVHTGATPRFADVDRLTQNIDPDLAARAVTHRTKAVLPVHFAGRPCDMSAVGSLARRKKLLLISDAAHAIEAMWKGKNVAVTGDLVCFSFYVTKNITTVEGGMVTTGKSRLAGKIKTYAMQGMTRDAWRRFSDKGYRHYRVVLPGFKYNLTDVNAAIGLKQLEKIERWWRRRRRIWDYYGQRFGDLPVFLPPPDVPGGRHALHLYTVHLDLEKLNRDRDAILAGLDAKGVGAGVHYVSLHLQPYYRKRFGFRPGDFPNALWISRRTLSLPLSAALSDAEVEHVADSFRAVVRRAEKRARRKQR
jgi:dTDP-4-amino-4,6-dideoxygalactose transaminase